MRIALLGTVILCGAMSIGCSGSTDEDSNGAGGAGGSSGGTGGTGATSGTGATGAGGTGGSGATGGGAGTDAGTTTCNATNCGFTCCGDQCVNTDNDIKNCGACGNTCGESANPFCNAGTCQAAPPCDPTTACDANTFCCGTTCCALGQLCCDVPGPVETGLTCVTPINGTCPPGCKDCKCNAPDTAIATPSGERAIAELAPGYLVYSVHGSAITVVPISKHQRVPAPGHQVVELELANGRVLHVSAAHPTADGRTLGELRAGDRLDGVAVVSTTIVPLTDGYTVDILPASDTGTYFAGGVLLKSTLAGR
jgi:hypothetical protein